MTEKAEDEEEEEESCYQPTSASTSCTSSGLAVTAEDLADRVANVSLGGSDVPKQETADRKAWLSKRQRIAIENSWKRATKSDADKYVGIQIFFRILAARPEIKHIFGLQKIPDGRLKYDLRFRRHAVILTKTFDYIVKNLAYKEKLQQHFQVDAVLHVLHFIPH
ncbi:unnamed protein product [Gongylonema pulchrum]|uniref:GLOBIN domain-containing protein n=1 Tax=Gongylonema pulchrum TaxID=637853 RepID=A0A183DR64_9BILA|nr:unnamed protein product [Gongylonema pulchrum]